MKYSILMPYHKRSSQLRSTLESFALHYAGRDDYEVIIIEDRKNAADANEHNSLVELVKAFPTISITVETRLTESCNPASAFNQARSLANGHYLVLTNPECVHKSDVLGGLDQVFCYDPDQYVVCSCLSVKEQQVRMDRLSRYIGPWYQHSQHRNTLCHFCSAISAELFDLAGGFDEEYDAGMCFEDDDFRNSVQAAGIEVVPRDDLVTLHLSHTRSKPAGYLDLHKINKKYYEHKWGKGAHRAEHLMLK